MKKFNSIFLFLVFLVGFPIYSNSQINRDKTNNFYVIASVGNNIEPKSNSRISVGNRIDISKNSFIKVDRYIAGIYELNNVSFEFRGPGIFNIDSAIRIKKITNSKEKLIAFISNSVRGAEEGKNIKSASVEMSINSRVVTFPSISKQADSTFTLYWNLNSSFYNKNPNERVIYSLIILNQNNDTCYFKYHANNSVLLNINNFTKTSNNGKIYHWIVTAFLETDDQKITSNINTFILEEDKNLYGTGKNLQIDSLMQKIDYSLKNAYYSKSLEYAKILNNLSPGTGKAAVQYSLVSLLDYNNEDSKFILSTLFNK